MCPRTMRYLRGITLSLPWMTLFNLTRPVEEFGCLGCQAAIPPSSVFIAPWHSSGRPFLPDTQNMHFICYWAHIHSGLRSGKLQGLSQGCAHDSIKSQTEPHSGLWFKLLATDCLANIREEAVWKRHQPTEKRHEKMQKLGPADAVLATGPVQWELRTSLAFPVPHHNQFSVVSGLDCVFTPSQQKVACPAQSEWNRHVHYVLSENRPRG